ncbi:caspase family protein [Occultella kanbiaonis]|uniref:caspase family protein n=1 Tax=Occultella kanbiaonis TaxID=2675754 RepID=UPI0013D49E15|nr:caspase family protein [Occultella kanbiaonis]
MSEFGVHEAHVDGPAAHVLVIGVGNYPHLLGGSGPLAAKHGGLGQLTSCPESARAFAAWVIAELDTPVPLGSVTLLLSEADPSPFLHPTTGARVAVARASADNVETALLQWRARGDAGAGERLVLFFSGHGIAAGADLTLLAEDYGAKPHNALDGAVDFRNLVAAMDQCLAREQLYFVDACRVGSLALLSAGSNNGRPIFQQDLLAPAQPQMRRAPVFYAALPGTSAYGTPGRPSVFTRALLAGLQGYGADDFDGGDWQVTPSRLQDAVEVLMALEAPDLGRLPVPAAEHHGRVVIRALAQAPNGLTIVECDPREATAAASFACFENDLERARRGPAKRAWAVPLPEGRYRFVAEFTDGSFRREEVERRVHPPLMRIPLRVRP